MLCGCCLLSVVRLRASCWVCCWRSRGAVLGVGLRLLSCFGGAVCWASAVGVGLVLSCCGAVGVCACGRCFGAVRCPASRCAASSAACRAVVVLRCCCCRAGGFPLVSRSRLFLLSGLRASFACCRWVGCRSCGCRACGGCGAAGCQCWRCFGGCFAWIGYGWRCFGAVLLWSFLLCWCAVVGWLSVVLRCFRCRPASCWLSFLFSF